VETQDTHGKDTDRAVRLLVMGKLIREMAGKPEPILKNVNPAQLACEVETALKLIKARRSNEEYEISSERIAHFSGTDCDSETPAERQLAVQ
jgi:hypothetical protein